MADELRARSCPDLVDRVDRWRAEAGLSRAEATKALVLRGLELGGELEDLRENQTDLLDRHDDTQAALETLEQDHDELAEGQDELEDRLTFRPIDADAGPDRAEANAEHADQDTDELEALELAEVEYLD